MAELTLNEKRLLAALVKEKKADAEHLASFLNATPEAVVQWGHLAEDKGLAKVERIVEKAFEYTDEGKIYLQSGLPKIRSFTLSNRVTLADLQGHPAFKIGFGQLRKKGFIRVEGSVVIKNEGTSTKAEESSLRNPVSGEPHTKELIKRGILAESETVRYAISITADGIALAKQGLDLKEEIGTLTRDQILSGVWKTANLRRYDIKKLPKTVYRESPTRTSDSSTKCALSFSKWALPRCTGRSSRARSGTSMPSSSRRITRPGRCRIPSTSGRKHRSLKGGSASAICTSMAGTPPRPAGAGSGTPKKQSSACSVHITTSLSIRYLATYRSPGQGVLYRQGLPQGSNRSPPHTRIRAARRDRDG